MFSFGLVWRATYREANFSAVRAVPPLSGQRHCSANVIAGLTASFWVPMPAELYDGEEEQKQTTEKERNPSERRLRGRRGIGPVPAPVITIASRPAGLQRHKSKVADPFQDTQTRTGGAAGSHRLHTQEDGSLRSHTYRGPLPAHTSSNTLECDRTRSTASAPRGGSDSQRERRQLEVTPGPTTQQDTATRGRKRGETKKKRGEEREAAKQTPTHTHTHRGRPETKTKDKRGCHSCP